MNTNVNRQYPVSVLRKSGSVRQGLRDLTVQNMDQRYSNPIIDSASYRSTNDENIIANK